MREHAFEAPSLFDLTPDSAGAPESAGKTPARVAGEFVRWLFSVGTDFRNSPDMTNLRFWLQQQRIEIQDGEAREILGEARTLFARKLGQLLRKSDAKSDNGSIRA